MVTGERNKINLANFPLSELPPGQVSIS